MIKSLHIKKTTPMQSLEKIAKERGTTAAKIIEEANRINSGESGNPNKYLIIGGVAVFLVILIILIIRIKKKKK